MGADGMAIRAVIFDIGGVLLFDTGGNKWTDRLGLTEEEFVQRLVVSGVIGPANAGTMTAEDLWSRLGMTYHLAEDQLQEFREDNWALQEPNLELIDFLRSLQSQYKTATLSNDWPGAREEQNRLFQLEDLLGVDAMLYSCEEGMQKPEAAFYRLACERLAVYPNEVVFVDDRQPCIDAARDLGMTGILFQDTAQVMMEIQAYLAAAENGRQH
jgi:epoxide hydrolase-like predicted phosphatase